MFLRSYSLNTELGKRLWVANTPLYSPEYNPDELVGANSKRVKIPNQVPKNVRELTEIAHGGIDATATEKFRKEKTQSGF